TEGMNGGICRELRERMETSGGMKGLLFDPETFKYVSQLMSEESGLKLLFHTFVESALVEGNEIKGIFVVNKGGRQLLRSRIVIDATGDGDVAASAGAPYEKGRKGDGRMQALTLRSRIGGVDDQPGADWRQIQQVLDKERKNGTVSMPDYIIRYFGAGMAGIKGDRTFNMDMITGADATDPWQLTEAELKARKCVWELIDFARAHIPGWANCYLIDTAVHIGIRETRRLSGRYVLTKEDVLQARKFEDGIARTSFWLDLHDAEAFSYPGGYSEYIKKVSLPKGEWYEIPYRCLVPREIEALLVCGRCISSDREANGSLRIMPTCMNTGEAAGTAAAMSVKGDLPLSKISGPEVRDALIQSGAEL
ncbi:FAD-dependent oxidoreductase, partial [Verrucomicrobiota bacterium]